MLVHLFALCNLCVFHCIFTLFVFLDLYVLFYLFALPNILTFYILYVIIDLFTIYDIFALFYILDISIMFAIIILFGIFELFIFFNLFILAIRSNRDTTKKIYFNASCIYFPFCYNKDIFFMYKLRGCSIFQVITWNYCALFVLFFENAQVQVAQAP